MIGDRINKEMLYDPTPFPVGKTGPPRDARHTGDTPLHDDRNGKQRHRQHGIGDSYLRFLRLQFFAFYFSSSP